MRHASMLWGNIKTTSKHNLLGASGLEWASSAHTGTPNSYAAFNASGSAFNVVYDVQALSGTSPSWDMANGINAVLPISGNTTITFSNVEPGTSGNLTVTNPASGYS